jgi:hypothetical protein
MDAAKSRDMPNKRDFSREVVDAASRGLEDGRKDGLAKRVFMNWANQW